MNLTQRLFQRNVVFSLILVVAGLPGLLSYVFVVTVVFCLGAG